MIEPLTEINGQTEENILDGELVLGDRYRSVIGFVGDGSDVEFLAAG